MKARLPLLLPVLALLAAPFAAPAPAHAAGSTFGAFFETLYGYVNDYSWYPEVGDLDGDGKDDLVRVVGSSTQQLIVRFGETNGRLSGYPEFLSLPAPLGNQYSAWPCIHDIDGDGIADIVIGDPTGIVVVRGLGGRTFAPAVTLADPARGYVSAADFDGDDIQDYACVSAAGDSVRIRFGTGSLAFTPGPAFPMVNGYDVYLRDFDGDTRMDVFVPGSSNSKLLLNQGGGTFLPFDVAAGFYPTPAGDLNGDGREDLFSSAGAYLSQGDGTFSAAIPHGMTGAVCTADLNEDGKLDLIGVQNSGATGQTWVELGHGDGTFGPPIVQRTVYGAAGSGGAAIGDFDQDGHADLVFLKWDTSSEFYMFGTGSGTFRQNARIYGSGPAGPVVAARIAGAPSPDLLLFRTGTSTFARLPAQGLADYGAPVTLTAAGGYSSFAVADLNGDDREDVVVGYSGLATISTWLAQPDGSLGARADSPVSSTTQAIALADLDGDDTPDLLASVNGANAWWRHGNGDGTFGTLHALGDVLGNRLLVADLDRNGLPDIVSGGSFGYPPHWPPYGIRVMLGTGVGAFGPPVDYAEGFTGPSLLTVGFVDSDSLPDLTIGADSVRVLHGMGAGVLGGAVALGNVPFAVQYAGDANGDGRTDFVGYLASSSAAAVCFGGEMGPEPVVGFGAALGVTGATFADIDGNGVPDLVANTNQGVTVLFNQTITPNVDVPIAGPPRAASRFAVFAAPNPAFGRVQLRLAAPGTEPLEVELFDLSGRRVSASRIARADLSTAGVSLPGTERLAPGVYLVRARQGAETATARVCVMR